MAQNVLENQSLLEFEMVRTSLLPPLWLSLLPPARLLALVSEEAVSMAGQLCAHCKGTAASRRCGGFGGKLMATEIRE